MTPLQRIQSAGPTTTDDDRLRDLLGMHFHPEWGSAYWLQRQEQLGWDVRDRVRTLDDLWQLGPTPVADLRRLPVHDRAEGRHPRLGLIAVVPDQRQGPAGHQGPRDLRHRAMVGYPPQHV